LHHSQYGFHQGKKIDQAIANLTQFIYKSLDNNKKCATVYLDLTKTFDIVDHDILIIKLKQLGIFGNNLKLFTCNLSNRKQCVKINKTISSLKTIKCGVPRGTVIYFYFF
jgi:RNA binding exosome subunit